MSLLFIDGFDHYATADLGKKWSTSNGSIASTSGRRGGGALALQSQAATLNLAAQESALIAGVAVKLGSYVSGQQVLQVLDNGTVQAGVTLHPDGSITVTRGSSTVIASSLPGVFTPLSWFYLEAKLVIHDTTGAVEIRVNGNTVIAATNVNTQVTANAYATQLKLQTTVTVTSWFDDLYLLDTAGTVNNDFLGDCRVDAYYPTSEGAVQAWAPTPAGTHYTTVDETTPNTTDYVSSATVGDKELFGVTDLVNTPLSIFGVQANSAAWKTDAGFRAIKNLVRIAGTDYPSSDLDVTETSRYCRNIWDQNPATSAAWTDAAVNGAEFGVQVA